MSFLIFYFSKLIVYFSIISFFSIIFAFPSLLIIILGFFVTYVTNFRCIRSCCRIHVIFNGSSSSKLEYTIPSVIHTHLHPSFSPAFGYWCVLLTLPPQLPGSVLSSGLPNLSVGNAPPRPQRSAQRPGPTSTTTSPNTTHATPTTLASPNLMAVRENESAMRVFPTTTSRPAQQDEGSGVLDIMNMNEFSFDDVQLFLDLRVGEGEVERKAPMEPGLYPNRRLRRLQRPLPPHLLHLRSQPEPYLLPHLPLP